MEKLKDIKYLIALNIIFIVVCIICCCVIIKNKSNRCDCPKCEITNNENTIQENITKEESQPQKNSCSDYYLNAFGYGLEKIDYKSNNITNIDMKYDIENNKATITAYNGNNITWQKSLDALIGGQHMHFQPISIDGNILYIQQNGKIITLNLDTGEIIDNFQYGSNDYKIVTIRKIYEDSNYIIIDGNPGNGHSATEILAIIDKTNKKIKNIIDYNDEYAYKTDTVNGESHIIFVVRKDNDCELKSISVTDILDDSFKF